MDDIKVDAREITESISQHDIMNTAPPGQTRERRAADRDYSHGAYSQMVASQQREQRAQVNYSVLEIDEYTPAKAQEQAIKGDKGRASGVESREPQLASTGSNLLIDSQRTKLEEYGQKSDKMDDALKTGEFNPYTKVMEHRDEQLKDQEKKEVRSSFRRTDSIPTSQAESYRDVHVMMTNTSMEKLKRKLGQIVPDRQYQMPQYMIIENNADEPKQLDVKEKKFLEKYVFAENKEKKEILKVNQR